MSQRFYVNCELAPGGVTLEGPEAHHLAGVCRLRPGDSVCLFNGDGHEYPATVVACTRSRVELNVLRVESPARELPQRLEVAAPLPKGDRAQFLIEKLTELGVAVFIPLRTARSIVHPGETRREKLERYVIEASKQCGRNVLMQVTPLTKWQEHCTRSDLPSIRLMAHPVRSQESEVRGQESEASSPSVRLIPDSWPLTPDCALAVGPEGGFTDEEISLAENHGWRSISLGPRILRVETAAIALAARFGSNGL
jgi:16S rRNA (uracil1498-N3)-methyltransferase